MAGQFLGRWLAPWTTAILRLRAQHLVALLAIPLALAGCAKAPPTEIVVGKMGPMLVEPPQKGAYTEGASGPWVAFVVKAAFNSYARPDEFPADLAFQKDKVQRELKRFLAARSGAFWIGHATFLIRSNGFTILTDPVFGNSTSPMQAIGPKRYAPPALTVDELPKIDAILVSHNHYDHLDIEAMTKIAARDPAVSVLVPKGNERLVVDAGFLRVRGYSAGESVTSGTLEITALPAYHETSRMGFDAHQTLALGWSIRRLGGGPSIYFAGDTAYGPVFKQIRRNFGPHEYVFVPIGAYEPREEVRHVHASPEEAAKIASELGASVAIGMHWGTFPLSDEPVMEPAERFKAAPGPNRILRIGEAIVFGK